MKMGLRTIVGEASIDVVSGGRSVALELLLEQRLDVLHLGHDLRSDGQLLVLVPVESEPVGDEQLQVVFLLLGLDVLDHLGILHVLHVLARDLDYVVVVLQAGVCCWRVWTHVAYLYRF